MNEEFRLTDEQRDLDFLKSFRPEWENDRLEPLTPPVEDSVIPPNWQKAQIEIPTVSSGGGGGGAQTGTERVICAVQEGDTFVPKIMIPVEGTLFEDA